MQATLELNPLRSPDPPSNHALSLADQIQRANFWLTMLIVLCLGGSMLALSLSEVTKTQTKANTASVNAIGQILMVEIHSQIDSIADLAANPITWTSLTDTTGREVYLKPLLAARDSSAGASQTTLFDYKGRHLVGSQSVGAEQAHTNRLVADVLRYQRRQMEVLHGSTAKLLMAEPVIYPYTQDVIGILTSEIDLNALFVHRVASERTDVGVELLHASNVVASTSATVAHTGYLPVSFDFALELNHEGRQTYQPDHLSLRLYSVHNPWWASVLRLLALALAIGVLLAALVWRISHNMGRRIAARIERLASECEAVSAGSATQVTADAQGDEIGVLSRTLNHALAAYHHINQNLESVVAQKTQALSDSESRFRGFFEHNISAVLQIDARSGQIVLANQAAADFYGYSLERLMALHIADINCAPPETIQAKMGLVESQNQHSFLMQHRLCSGEVRDVEVYSTALQIDQNCVLLSVIHDITDQLLAARKLKISDQALMSISQGVIVTDAQGCVVWMNQAFIHITGHDHADTLGRTTDFLHGLQTEPDTIAAIAQAVQEGRQLDAEIINYRKNGELFWNALTISPIRDDSGTLRHWVGIIRDVTEHKHAQQRLQLAASVFTFAREGIMITRPDSTIVEINQAFTTITGYGQDEVVGNKPHLLTSGRQDKAFFAAMRRALHTQGHWQGEIWNRRKTGELYAAMLNISAVRNSKDEVDHFVALYTDITTRKNQEQQLLHSAHYDALTGLANRVLFANRLAQATAHAAHSRQLLALVYLDLDGFKAVNDNYGHEAGDVLLIAVAQRMQDVLREGDTLARIGGDEFVAVLVDVAAPADSLPVMQRLLAAASTPVWIDGQWVQVSASVGATYFPQLGRTDTTAEQLIKQADQTMYHAKQSGKNRIHIFDAAQNQPVRAELEGIEA